MQSCIKIQLKLSLYIVVKMVCMIAMTHPPRVSELNWKVTPVEYKYNERRNKREMFLFLSDVFYIWQIYIYERRCNNILVFFKLFNIIIMTDNLPYDDELWVLSWRIIYYVQTGPRWYWVRTSAREKLLSYRLNIKTNILLDYIDENVYFACVVWQCNLYFTSETFILNPGICYI